MRRLFRPLYPVPYALIEVGSRGDRSGDGDMKPEWQGQGDCCEIDAYEREREREREVGALVYAMSIPVE